MLTSRPEPDWVDPADLAARLGGTLLDGAGRVQAPLLLVDLGSRAAPRVAAAAVEVARTSDRILVGVARHGVPDPVFEPLVEALDLTLVPVPHAADHALVGVADPERAAVELHAAVAANPRAALVLAGLLRWSGTLPVAAALDAESLAYSTLLGGPEFRCWLDRRGSRPPPPPARVAAVLVERSGGTLRVTLNRPERCNAYGREVRDGLVAALEIAVFDDTVTEVVLAGAGRCFSAGGDLDEFGTAPDPVTAHFVRTRAGAARLLHRVARRTTARVHGVCVGAGIELPAFVHRVVATPDAAFHLPEVGMGLIPGAGGTVGIPRRIGRWRTLYLALSGRTANARTALAWGLVDEVADPDSTRCGKNNVY